MLTVPNAVSLVRILLIPVVVWLLWTEGTEAWGIGLLVLLVSTDWADGQIARRTGQVTDVGKILDPVADRLILAAALITLVVRDAFPLWAAALIIVRDVLVLGVGLVFMAGKKIRIDVRFIGKAATFMLMAAIPLIAWGNFGLPAAWFTSFVGWPLFVAGCAAYYAAAWLYLGDLSRARRPAGAQDEGSS